MQFHEIHYDPKANFINISADLSLAALVYRLKTIVVDTKTRQPVAEICKKNISAASFSPDNSMLALHGETQFHLYDLQKKCLVKTCRTGQGNMKRGIFFGNAYVYSRTISDPDEPVEDDFWMQNPKRRSHAVVEALDIKTLKKKKLCTFDGMARQFCKRGDDYLLIGIDIEPETGGYSTVCFVSENGTAPAYKKDCHAGSNAFLSMLGYAPKLDGFFGLHREQQDKSRIALFQFIPETGEIQDLCFAYRQGAGFGGLWDFVCADEYAVAVAYDHCVLLDLQKQEIADELSAFFFHKTDVCDAKNYFCTCTGGACLFEIR